MGQWVSGSVGWLVSGSVGRSVSRSVSQSVSQSVKQSVKQSHTNVYYTSTSIPALRLFFSYSQKVKISNDMQFYNDSLKFSGKTVKLTTIIIVSFKYNFPAYLSKSDLHSRLVISSA